MNRFKSYSELFGLLDGDWSGVSLSTPGLRRRLKARLMKPECVPHDEFFGAVEDVIESAAVREVRKYPKGREYVRYEIRVLDVHGVWSEPYQLLALFDSREALKAYTIVRGRTRRERIPAELRIRETDSIYVARQLKRALMLAKRSGNKNVARTLACIGVDDTRDRMVYKVRKADLNWEYIRGVWNGRGYPYRDNILMYLAINGDTSAQCEVAWWFDVKEKPSKWWAHPDLARYWYGLGAKAGDPMAQTNLATLIGRDCDKLSQSEFAEMRSLLKAAAAQDFPAALRRLWHCCECAHCGVFDADAALAYHSRYKKVEKQSDSSGRLAKHREAKYPGVLPLGVKI